MCIDKVNRTHLAAARIHVLNAHANRELNSGTATIRHLRAPHRATAVAAAALSRNASPRVDWHLLQFTNTARWCWWWRRPDYVAIDRYDCAILCVCVCVNVSDLPGYHLAERLVVHVAATVTPLPVVGLPIVLAADPLDAALRIVALQVLAQYAVLQPLRLGQLTVALLAVEVRVQPVHFGRRQEVALLADAHKVRRTQSVHALYARSGRCGGLIVRGAGELSECQECCWVRPNSAQVVVCDMLMGGFVHKSYGPTLRVGRRTKTTTTYR